MGDLRWHYICIFTCLISAEMDAVSSNPSTKVPSNQEDPKENAKSKEESPAISFQEFISNTTFHGVRYVFDGPKPRRYGTVETCN